MWNDVCVPNIRVRQVRYCSIAYCKHECDGDDRPAMVGDGSALFEYMWRFLVQSTYVLSLESERL